MDHDCITTSFIKTQTLELHYARYQYQNKDVVWLSKNTKHYQTDPI